MRWWGRHRFEELAGLRGFRPSEGVAALRGAGWSWRRIAAEFGAEGVPVSHSSLRRWYGEGS